MTDESGPASGLRRFARWATTPPQAYGAYFVALLLVYVLSFYAGTTKPKPAPQPSPPAMAPRN